MSQSASTLIPMDITAGNGVLWYAPTYFDSFTTAKSSTKWRKFGMMKDQVNLQVPREFLDFYSGVPSGLQQTYVTSEDVMLGGTLLEGNPGNIARIMGGLTVTRTTKASNPAPTTAETGSTKTSIIMADSSGYAAGDEIKVGNQFGRIKSLDSGTDTATLYEGLSDDAAPTPGDTVAKVDTSSFDLGVLTALENIALKFSHTMIGGYGAYDLIILKAQVRSNLDVNYQDNTKTPDSVGFPFTAMSIKDPEIEDGKMARWEWTQS